MPLNQSEYIGSSGTNPNIWDFSRNEGAIRLQDWGRVSKHRACAPGMAEQADSCHVFFHKEKSYEMSKNLRTTRATITLASPQRIRNTKRQHPAESPFSCLRTPPSASPRRGRGSSFSLVGRKAFVQITFFIHGPSLTAMIRITNPVGAM